MPGALCSYKTCMRSEFHWPCSHGLCPPCCAAGCPCAGLCLATRTELQACLPGLSAPLAALAVLEEPGRMWQQEEALVTLLCPPGQCRCCRTGQGPGLGAQQECGADQRCQGSTVCAASPLWCERPQPSLVGVFEGDQPILRPSTEQRSFRNHTLSQPLCGRSVCQH